MISLDTELMKTLVEGCVTANNNIDDAVAALTGIVSHNDWGCKEKTKIDEYTNTNKNKVLHLQESSDNFLKVLRQVTIDFEEAEKSVIDSAGGLDSSIGSAIAIGTVGIADAITKDLNSSDSAFGGSGIMQEKVQSIIDDIKSKFDAFTDTKIGGYIKNAFLGPIAPVDFTKLKI